jgi:hypothetical protein
MSHELYACAYIAEFPAQALLRLRVNLQSEPVTVLEGRAPQRRPLQYGAFAHSASWRTARG